MILSSAIILPSSTVPLLSSPLTSVTLGACGTLKLVCGVCLQSRKHSTNRKTAGQANVPTPLPMADSQAGCGPHYLCLSRLPLIKVGNDRYFSYVYITEDPNTQDKQLRGQNFRRLNPGSIGPRYLGRASQPWEHMGRCLLHGWPGRMKRRRKDKADIKTGFIFSLVCSAHEMVQMSLLTSVPLIFSGNTHRHTHAHLDGPTRAHTNTSTRIHKHTYEHTHTYITNLLDDCKSNQVDAKDTLSESWLEPRHHFRPSY